MPLQRIIEDVGTDPLVGDINECLGLEGREVLAGAGLPTDAESLVQKLGEAAVETARRVCFLVTGELRMVTRLLTRLDETLPKMPSAGKLEDLSEFYASAPALRSRAAFVLTPTCAAMFE